jgi:hypothetical protein
VLLVNLFGGPGVGKSTHAAGLFYRLKQAGINAELVTEFAKELVWEERSVALAMQPYILGKQFARLERLRNKVDIAITDSPLMLSIHYNTRWRCLPDFVHELASSFENLNLLLEREPTRVYNPAGRYQDEQGAKAVDVSIVQILNAYKVLYEIIPYFTDSGKIVDRPECIYQIVKGVLEKRA